MNKKHFAKFVQWFKQYGIFSKKTVVYDAADIVLPKYKPKLLLNEDGNLYYHAPDAYGIVIGAGKWDKETKKKAGLPTNITVIDSFITLKEIHE